MRIGSTGALQDHIKLRDIVIGQGACTDSNWASQYHLAGMFAPIADFHMLETCVETAKEMGVAYHVGNILSSDRFYGDDGDMPEGWNANHGWKKMGVLAVEMEAAAPRGDDRRRAPERLHPDDGARAQDLGQARKVTAEAPYFTALFAPKGWNKA